MQLEVALGPVEVRSYRTSYSASSATLGIADIIIANSSGLDEAA